MRMGKSECSPSSYKRGDKQRLKNYRPVSLLPNCRKIPGRLIFNEMLRFLLENNLISSNQSGFKSGDSCINHGLSRTHEIYTSFHDKIEVRGVFVTSNTFHQVWHTVVIFELNKMAFPVHYSVFYLTI